MVGSETGVIGLFQISTSWDFNLLWLVDDVFFRIGMIVNDVSN